MFKATNHLLNKEEIQMSANTIIAKINYIKELEASIEEMKNELEGVKDSIKSEMTQNGVEQMAVGDYIIRYCDVLSSRFDTKRFKEEIGEDVYKYYTKEVMSKRFSIA